jgi:hypothetical protein
MAPNSYPFVALVLFGGSIGQSFGQSPATNAGTLTCTVANVPNSPSGVIELSCNFKSVAGITSDYEASGGTKTGTLPAAKHVYVWSVVAADKSKAPPLEGTFAAESGREGPAVLIGGVDRSIRLEPAGRSEQLAGPGEITTLTLKLAVTKT